MARKQGLAAVRYWRAAAETANRKIACAVRVSRLEGASWRQIGEAAGMAPQSAWHRWGRGEPPTPLPEDEAAE